MVRFGKITLKRQKKLVSNFQKKLQKYVLAIDTTYEIQILKDIDDSRIGAIQHTMKINLKEFLSKLNDIIILIEDVGRQVKDSGYLGLKEDVKMQLREVYMKHLKIAENLASELEQLKSEEERIHFEENHIANALIKEVESFEKQLDNFIDYDKTVMRKIRSIADKTQRNNLQRALWQAFAERQRLIKKVKKLCRGLVKKVVSIEVQRVKKQKEAIDILSLILNNVRNVFKLGAKLIISAAKIRARSMWKQVYEKHPAITTIVIDVDECLIDTTGIRDLARQKYLHGDEIYKILEINTRKGALSFDESIRIMYRLLEGFTTIRDYYDALSKAKQAGLINTELLQVCKKWKAEGKEVILATRSNVDYIKPLAREYGLDDPIGAETQRHKGYVLNTTKIIGLFNWRDEQTKYMEKIQHREGQRILYIGHELLDINEIAAADIGVFLKRKRATKMETLGRLLGGYDEIISREKIRELERLL